MHLWVCVCGMSVCGVVCVHMCVRGTRGCACVCVCVRARVYVGCPGKVKELLLLLEFRCMVSGGGDGDTKAK